jgi:hypothetical protein
VEPTPDATAEELITSWIKRDMAKLLYPVDLSTFLRPEKDTRFRDLIMVLQKQMGASATGILTSDQFNRLGQAAREIEAGPIGLRPSKMVSMVTDGYVSAQGTLAGDNLAHAHEINHTRIECARAEGTCTIFSASFNVDNSFLPLQANEWVVLDHF